MTGKSFNSHGLVGIGAALKKGVDEGYVPGLVAAVRRTGQTQAYAFGSKALDGPDPMGRDTLFRIASMTKLVTASAVMILVQDGKLKLDAPVDRWLPELANRRVLKRPDATLDDTVPAARPITVEDILTFRHGWGIVLGPPTWPINTAVADLGIVGFGPPNPRMPHDVDAWLERLGTLPLLHQPGEAWMYTNGSDIQGALVARASGQPFDRFIAERITGPLGMKDTGFAVPADQLDRLCDAYQPRDGKLALYDGAADSDYRQTPKFPEGDAGLVSCIDDLLAFSEMLLGGGARGATRILTDASVRAMTTNHVTAEQVRAANGQFILNPALGWGYGMAVVQTPWSGLEPGAFGWSGGFGTSWYMDPTKGLTTILLTQRLFETPDPPSLHKAFWAAAYGALA
ncbi:MAG: beta-lactamase family protein [Proteobacteria bacterium]|nr:beta-lactamase family protein [Pseudomonadota bacterium]